MKNLQKSFIQFIIIAIISINLGGAGWYVYEVIKTSKYKNISKNINLVSDWEVYKNEKYGFSFKYPKDWTIKNFDEQKIEGIGGAIVIKNLTDGNMLVFNVGRVSSGSLNSPNVRKKIIFLEKEAYIRDFNLCIGEGANSTEECYLRIIELIINNNDGLSITYGTGGQGTGTKENHEIVQKNLETIFDANQNIFDEMLNTVELVEKQ